MAPPRKNISQATTIAPTVPKEKEKAIEAVEPTSYQTNQSDVHIHGNEGSHHPLPHRRGCQLLNPSPSIPASNSSRCFPDCRSRWRISKQRWFDSARRLLFKKTQLLMSRLDYSKKLIHYESRSLLVPPKKELGLPRHHSITGNLHNPPAMQSATGQRLATMMSTPMTQSVPKPWSFLVLRISRI